MKYLEVSMLVTFLFSAAVWRDGECDEMVKLYNNHLTITSSTLTWTSVSPEEALPPNVVTISNGGPPWCRAREHAVWVPGAVLEGQCRVPFLGTVQNIEDFQVLVSENASARLEKVRWDHLVVLPSNVVSTPNMLLAVSTKSDEGVPNGLPGFVEAKERRAHFLLGNETIASREGLLLTEVEPVAYRLTDVRLDDRTKRPTSKETLQEFELTNPHESPGEVSSEVAFVVPHLVDFGRIKGTVTNLPTDVSGPDIFPLNIRWRINNEMQENRTHTVTYHLPAQSSVKVRLIAVIRNLEGPYSARLTSIYEDGVELERNIEGFHRERKLAELRADFDNVVSLVDGAPIGSPSSTILLHSTTTTSAPPSAGSSSSNPILPKPEGVGVNRGGHLYSLPSLLLVRLALHFILW